MIVIIIQMIIVAFFSRRALRKPSTDVKAKTALGSGSPGARGLISIIIIIIITITTTNNHNTFPHCQYY